ncbi:MAG: hypothetical protein SCK28_04550 [Bacillota bacterium]|nr:hypothetical protein [Bacillota bacterium]
MQNNFFILELDTTPPNISIIAPNYTVPNVETEIIIEGNEVLSQFQDIYIIDAKGTRHDVIFNYSNDKFIGRLIFNDFSIGIATVHARLKDEVLNLSDRVSKTIDIRMATKLILTIDEITREICAANKTRFITLSESIRGLNCFKNIRGTVIYEATRKIEVREG